MAGMMPKPGRVPVTRYLVSVSRPSARYSPFDPLVTGNGTAPLPLRRSNRITVESSPAPAVVRTWPLTIRLVRRWKVVMKVGKAFGAKATSRLVGSKRSGGLVGCDPVLAGPVEPGLVKGSCTVGHDNVRDGSGAGDTGEADRDSRFRCATCRLDSAADGENTDGAGEFAARDWV